jgi:hypothetical protein
MHNLENGLIITTRCPIKSVIQNANIHESENVIKDNKGIAVRRRICTANIDELHPGR